MTGNPKDWCGHQTSDLVAARGQPTRIIHQTDGEIWEYVNEGDFIVPKGSHMVFNMGGFGNSSAFAGGGGFVSEKNDQHKSHYVVINRFEVKNGIIKKWYGERDVDGRMIWHGH